MAAGLAIGGGGSGGGFAPSLLMPPPRMTCCPGPRGRLTGAGSARAAIMVVIIMFELTGEYTIIQPLMSAIVLATPLGRAPSAEAVYTLMLRRWGADIDHRLPVDVLAGVTVAHVMD